MGSELMECRSFVVFRASGLSETGHSELVTAMGNPAGGYCAGESMVHEYAAGD